MSLSELATPQEAYSLRKAQLGGDEEQHDMTEMAAAGGPPG